MRIKNKRITINTDALKTIVPLVAATLVSYSVGWLAYSLRDLPHSPIIPEFIEHIVIGFWILAAVIGVFLVTLTIANRLFHYFFDVEEIDQ